MQIISVPNYNFRKLQTGQLLKTDAEAATATIEMNAITGFTANNFAVLGFDSQVELAEIVQVVTVNAGPVTLDISASAYWHEKENLVFPTPYNQIDLYKKVEGGAMQLFQRKDIDVDGLDTAFIDENALETDTYEYKYRNSITEAVSTASDVGLQFLHQDDPYITPEDVLSYMHRPQYLPATDANLIMLCAAYSDLLDHTVGRYKEDRLWYHPTKIVIPGHKITPTFKFRVTSPNEKPIVDILEAFILDPAKGKKKVLEQPFEIRAGAIVYIPDLERLDYDDTDRLVLMAKTGFFSKDEVPEDIRMMLVQAVANHIRREDIIRRYVHFSGQLVSGESTGSSSSTTMVKMITVGKYRKSFFESAAEGLGERVNSKTLRAMKIAFDDVMLKEYHDVFRRYQQTLGFTFL